MKFFQSVADFSDRLVSSINPKAGFERSKYRVATENVRAYEAAQKGRRLKGWKAGSTSQNTEVVYSLSDLRNRSRDLVRNNPYAKRAIEIISTNVIGTGITPTPKGPTPKINKAAKDAFESWAYSNFADANRQMNLFGLQRLICRSMSESGEVIIRKVKRNNGTGIVPLAIQVLESDFLDHNKNDVLRNGNYIIQGVEFDRRGIRVGYWLFESHPGDIMGYGNAESKRVSADEIIHLYRVYRPGQVRGIPDGVASFIRMRDLDSYADAQLVQQQLAACYVGFIQDATETFTQGGEYDGSSKLEPGSIELLPPGKTITFANPPKPTGYESYTRTVLREIAVAYGISYEALTADFSNVNFSSARMAWIEFGRLIEELQELVFIPMFLNTLWDWFNEAAIVSGVIRKPIPANWTAPRRAAVDPAKEVAALKEMVRAGFISKQEAIRQSGYNPEEVAKEIEDDNKDSDKRGFMFTTDPRNDPARKAPFPIPNAIPPEDPPPITDMNSE